MHKLSHADGEGHPVIWPNYYRRETTTGPDRLVIAPRSDAMDMLCDLAQAVGPEYFLLYIHAVSCTGTPTGRYESPPLQLIDVRLFAAEYQAFLEGDARHELWIGSTTNDGMLVYDDHGLVYAYGPLEEFMEALGRIGFESGEFSIPSPHAHHFHHQYDADLDRLMSHVDWLHTDLRPEDER